MRILCILVVVLSSWASVVSALDAAGTDEAMEPMLSDGHASEFLVSTSSSSLALRETAGPDTFFLLGGPGSLDGKFQDASGGPDWRGWVGVDATDIPNHWQISMHNAENLNSHGPGNLAYWCGLDAAATSGWASPGGYGNSWVEVLIYESAPVVDPSAGETVFLDFYFNIDVEPGYDFLVAQYDSAGTWTDLLAIDGSNKDTNNVFQAPGVSYTTTNNGHGIVYTGNDFGGDSADQIRIRLVVRTDGGWSDEDGMWPTHGGAAQVDDISVTSSNASFTQDHDVTTGYFIPDKAPFAGDFSDIFFNFSDLDPCRNNRTPMVGFLDYGQTVRNGPGVTGLTSTGGSTSANWSYGINGGYVVNYTDGISGGGVPLHNEVHSPIIDWDPGVAITDPSEVVGVELRYNAWIHLPLINGMFYTWRVRSRQAGAVAWAGWQDRSFVYYGGGVASWGRYERQVTDLIVANPSELQVAFRVMDYAGLFGFPGNDATPSPMFDDISLLRYRVAGPVISTRQINLSNDGFPANGTLDVSTAAGRGLLDIPFDMARDINSGSLVNAPGDSITVDVNAQISGSSVTDVRMKWALKTNPLFEDALRSAPARAKDVNVVAGPVGTIWTGEVIADSARTLSGAIVAERFFLDLPDVDFMYPGDALQFYIEATDSSGRVTTLPANTTDFGIFSGSSGFDRGFWIRGLPSITNQAGNQPDVLVWNDFGHRGGENDFLGSLSNLGMAEGIDFDTYTTNGPSSGVSNGLGSAGAHGASVVQVAGYNTILYFAGNLSSILLSDGSDANSNDKGNDLGLLTAWSALPGDRHIAYFGDYVSSGTKADSPGAGAAYVANNMGVIVNDSDVRDEVDNQTAPLVRPLHAAFTTEYAAYGGCLGINQFDSIEPGLGAVAGHGFVDLLDVVYPGPQASVVYDRLSGVDRKVDVTFPYSMMYIYDKVSRASVGTPSRTRVFAELFGLFGVTVPGGSPITGAPRVLRAALSVSPTPFNPMTTVKFSNVLGQSGMIRVYNLRGELVTTLHEGEFTRETFDWNGRDGKGASVASGIYVIQASSAGEVLTKKVALVK